MPLRVRSCALSDVGIARDNNEDAFLVDEVSGLFLVADGMGGHASGEVASRLCCENVFRVMRTARHSPDFQFPFEIEERRSFEENALANAIKVANQKIFEASAQVQEYRGMGTTVVALLEDPDRIIVAHVGDSRCYRLREGKLSQVTRDHSLLNHYIHERGMTYEEASKLTESNVILRAVGLKEYIEVDLGVLPKVPGDIFLLCSDGLNDQVPDEVIEQVLNGCKGDMQAAAERFVQLANGHGGLDNCTVLMIEVYAPAEEGKPAGSRSAGASKRMGDAPPPPTTTGARRGAAPRLSAAARMAAAARAVPNGAAREEDDEPSQPGMAPAAPAAPAVRTGSGALPSVIIDFDGDSSESESNATQPMSRAKLKEAIEAARAQAGDLTAAPGPAAPPPPAPAPAAAPAAGFVAASSYDTTDAMSTSALPAVGLRAIGAGRRTPAGGVASATPIEGDTGKMEALPASGAAQTTPGVVARKTPAQGVAPSAPSPARTPRMLRAAVALQAAGVAIQGKPQPVRASAEPAGGTPRRASGSLSAAAGGAEPAADEEAPRTGGSASPEDAAQRKTRQPAVGIDRSGFIEGDADTPPGGVSVRRGPGEDVR